jgi:hypothetical protein
MVDVRTVLAAVLGIGLGALLVAYPEAIVRAHTAGRVPHDRGGAYGEEAALPDRWRLVVRVLGAVVLVAGVYFGATALSSV